MNKCDFAKRFESMVRKECEIIKAEAKIAQKSAKYYEQMTFLKTILAKQEEQLSKCRQEVQKFKLENDKLEKFKQREEDRLCHLIRKVEQMQLEYKQTLEQQINQRRTALFEMDCIRNMKLATQTYINLNALPQLIQGVTVKEKETSSEWKPFRIDRSKHTQKEVQDIWHDLQVDSYYKETWETLILGDVSKYAEIESEIGNVSVVK